MHLLRLDAIFGRVEPVYKRIEFCRKPETLYAKIESGLWDWLGVHPDGKFVLGSPARKVSSMRASPTVLRSGAKEGEHGVRVYAPLFPGASTTWCRTAEEAREEYERELETNRDGPLILKVRLIQDGEVAEEGIVIRRPPTYQ